MLRTRRDDALFRTMFEEEGVEQEEAQDLSGRTRLLIRKLRERGWIDFERDQDLEECIILPDDSIQILKLFYALTRSETVSGFSYVYDTDSTLHRADAEESGGAYEKMMALYSACEKAVDLMETLKTVYHNINRYFQRQAVHCGESQRFLCTTVRERLGCLFRSAR